MTAEPNNLDGPPGPGAPPVLLLRPIEAKHGDKSRANLLNLGL